MSYFRKTIRETHVKFCLLNVALENWQATLLDDLATVAQTKENEIYTNQKTALLLNGWPRTIAETMVTATKFMKFS